MYAPKSPGALREYVKSLPPWNELLDDDPNWLRPVEDYGYTLLSDRKLAGEIVRDAGQKLKNEKYEVVALDPNQVVYANQLHIRLDTLLHYMSSGVLFDKEPWYDIAGPVVVPYADAYLVLDGTHRILRDRLTDRTSLVALVSQE